MFKSARFKFQQQRYINMNASGFLELIFSLLPIIIGIVIAGAYSYAKKKVTPVRSVQKDSYIEDPEDFIVITGETEPDFQTKYSSTDYYKERKAPLILEEEEEWEEEGIEIDIRQAIICSEILRRPEY